MKRIGYYYPTQLLCFTTGFYFTQLFLSGSLMFWSGVAWGLAVLFVIGVIIWNARVGLKQKEKDRYPDEFDAYKGFDL